MMEASKYANFTTFLEDLIRKAGEQRGILPSPQASPPAPLAAFQKSRRKRQSPKTHELPKSRRRHLS